MTAGPEIAETGVAPSRRDSGHFSYKVPVMSYPKDLEDYTDDQLFAEVGRRNISLRNGLCWYCNQSLRTHTCKLATPQKQPAEVEAVVDLKERLAYVRAGCAALATKPDADSSIGRSTAIYVGRLAAALEKYLETGGR